MEREQMEMAKAMREKEDQPVVTLVSLCCPLMVTSTGRTNGVLMVLLQ